MSKMPTVFISHGGGPCFSMPSNPPGMWDVLENYLRGLPQDIGQTPKAILMVSAHWEEENLKIQGQEAPEMLFDYYGFPAHTYELNYPAPGSPTLAARTISLLRAAGHEIEAVHDRGFDHGNFVPMLVAWPDAEIPVIQLSLRADMDPAAHIGIGQALEPLRDEGVLIIGSGYSYHNMQSMGAYMRSGGDVHFGDEFNDWLVEAATSADAEVRNEALTRWASAPMARDAHPREEHLLPLHVVAGAAGEDLGKHAWEGRILGAVSSAFQYG